MHKFFSPNGDFTGLGALVALVLFFILCFVVSGWLRTW